CAALRQAADEIEHVAADQMLADEEVAPAGERHGVPAEREDEEGARAEGIEEATQAADVALPNEEAAEGEREEHRRHRPLGEGRGAERDERRAGIAPASVAPPGEGEAEGQGKKEQEKRVRAREAGASKERGHRGEKRRRNEPFGPAAAEPD